jgi:hypothetical protein
MDTNYNTTDASRPGSVLNILAGIWLIISPGVLGFAGLAAPTWNAVILGIAVLVLAAIRLGTRGTQALSWINCILGAWLVISPFVLQFADFRTPLGNTIILGVLVFLFGLWAALSSTTTGHYTGTMNRPLPR